MKKTLFFTILSFLCSLLLFTSCNDEPAKEENKDLFCRDKIVSYIKYDENDKEVHKKIYEYDDLGRKISYKEYRNDSLSVEVTDYTYNGKECNYTYNYYKNGEVSSTNKEKMVYYDDMYIKCVTYVNYDKNNQEQNRSELNYDDLGREIGLKHYFRGDLNMEHKDYVYNDKECKYILYDESLLEPLFVEYTKIYYDDLYIKYKSFVSDFKRLDEIRIEKYEYDNFGRETSYKSYLNGMLANEYKDYVYNGKECNYTYIHYRNGEIYSSDKIKIVFY
ncbi:hypothetical protein LJB95_00590 [Paludibacteraceae bacterium OttesenSCG-928-F17]|nr:hypothetical protein [Paludibacteraceae bacterium OttesenSCG-928-F17]